MKRILITGGAGFIGSYVAEELLAGGYAVRVLDALDPQVHEESVSPSYLPQDVELIVADIRDRSALDRALDGVQGVVHLAAAVGVGQSMYQLRKYVEINSGGTAALLEAIGAHRVERLVVASSMSVYGEGAYASSDGHLRHPAQRGRAQLAQQVWDPIDEDGTALKAVPTSEEVAPRPCSPYALTKYDQELMCLMYGAAYGVPTVALRLFNVYGPRQALSNPYTGVMAIFACRLLNRRPPTIFEDGRQLRDFVSVRDVARAFRSALETTEVEDCVLNVGSGSAVSVLGVARRLAHALGHEDLSPQIEGKYRVGDVRHCFADISRAEALLGYRPRVELDAGVEELAAWLSRQSAIDRAPIAAAELASRGLTL